MLSLQKDVANSDFGPECPDSTAATKEALGRQARAEWPRVGKEQRRRRKNQNAGHAKETDICRHENIFAQSDVIPSLDPLLEQTTVR